MVDLSREPEIRTEIVRRDPHPNPDPDPDPDPKPNSNPNPDPDPDPNPNPHSNPDQVRRIRARLAHAMGGGASRCARRFDVCAHVRGVNTEIGAADAAGSAKRKTWTTPLWAERDSLRRRRLPDAWCPLLRAWV